MRLDVYLFVNNFVKSRTNAQNLIKLSKVIVDGKVVNKPSLDVSDKNKIEIIENYDVNLGSLKISNIIKDFNLDLNNKVCLDLGCSNGGFTNFLIKNGALLVYCVDIGPCAFDYELLNHPKTIILDNTNARFLNKDMFKDNIDFITIDLSFISLTLILPVCYSLLNVNGEVVALIKPQFELDKNSLNKNGIVKNLKYGLLAVKKIEQEAIKLGFKHIKTVEAPHPFENKNQEFFIYLKKV